MTLNEFIAKYNGRFVDFDGWYGAQCVDLIQQYNKEMFNGPFLTGQGAADIWDTYPTSIYERIPNTPTGVPRPGDIMIWDRNYGPYGHIAIVTEATIDNFKCFSQNDPTGSASLVRSYASYNDTFGWLHPKFGVVVDQPIDDCPAKLKQVTEERDRLNGVITGKDETISHLGDTINAKNAEISSLQTRISGLDSEVLMLRNQLAVASEQALKVPELTTKLAECEASRAAYMAQVSKLQEQITKIKNTLVPKKYLSLKIYNLIMSLE